MHHSCYDLDRLFDLPRWQELQDHLAELTHMALITVDYKGSPITRHSMCCPFCKAVRANPQLERYCEICDSRGGLEAVRSQKPYIYLCHFNIIDIAIPITVDDKYLGAIMAGQIRLKDSADAGSFEHLLSSEKNAAAARQLKEYEKAYREIPELSYQQVQCATQALYELSRYIVEAAAEKNELLHILESFQATGLPSKSGAQAQDPSAQRGHYLKLHRSSGEELSKSILQPVFLYLDENRDEMVSMAQMAELCHLSNSYFSRLFAQQTGMPFSQYVAYQKTEWAKELLENDNCSVEEISQQLGFSSASYFIKVFKKQEGITPSLFRQYSKNANGCKLLEVPEPTAKKDR